MVWWGRAACPVRPVEAEWVDASLDWLLAEFGDERLRGTVVLPNDEFFPGVYRGTRGDVEAVLRRLCVHMGIPGTGSTSSTTRTTTSPSCRTMCRSPRRRRAPPGIIGCAPAVR
ncbi:hypothetical protein [Asanoa ishikariensis]|uniref:hypothetical protein n=1 Tax=Asanoa ishikariensis TaxID=137265 RepID=UPI0019505C3A|nr:hypothetical protein [Asanoa ishikariensis]